MKCTLIGMIATALQGWGFFGHEKVNELAVYTLPSGMIAFYKANVSRIVEASVNPDRRRYAVVGEAPRHYIDMDEYGDEIDSLPHDWTKAVARYTVDSLEAHGIVPWHIYRMHLRLRDAFLLQDRELIIRMSSELGHYVADAHVPLHTTSNYNGQKTGQSGIHGLWESRLPELFSGEYDFIVGPATYITNVKETAWRIVADSHLLVDSVLTLERVASELARDSKYGFETKGKQTIKVYSTKFSRKYHQLLQGMVERRMRASIHMVGSLWYTAWVDAGQPDLDKLIHYTPTEDEIEARRMELEQWKEKNFSARPHDR